jgi:hypothetical protein
MNSSDQGQGTDRRIREAKSGDERLTMHTAQTIVAMTLRFLDPGFDRADAEVMLGPVVSGQSPGTLVLKARDASIERASLEIIHIAGREFLSMIYLKYSSPVAIDIGSLVDRFGPPRVLPRLKPNQPIPHAFDVPTQHFTGGLLLGIDPDGGSVRGIRTIRLHRLPAEQK